MTQTADRAVATPFRYFVTEVRREGALDAVAHRWSLGRGTVVEPRHDASAVRIRYAAARATYA